MRRSSRWSERFLGRAMLPRSVRCRQRTPAGNRRGHILIVGNCSWDDVAQKPVLAGGHEQPWQDAAQDRATWKTMGLVLASQREMDEMTIGRGNQSEPLYLHSSMAEYVFHTTQAEFEART